MKIKIDNNIKLIQEDSGIYVLIPDDMFQVVVKSEVKKERKRIKRKRIKSEQVEKFLITKEQFGIKKVPIREIIKTLGISFSGGTYKRVKKIANKLGWKYEKQDKEGFIVK